MPNFIEKNCDVCGIAFAVTYKLRNKQCCSKECSYKLRMIKRKETSLSTGGIAKNCNVCGSDFLDPTRKGDMVKCKSCSYSQMVKARKENGSYTHNEDRRKWQSDFLKRKYSEGWNPNTPEHREKLSKKMKERWESGKMRNGLHWTQTSEGKRKLSRTYKGRKFTETALLNMRKGAASRVRSGKLKSFRGKGGIREDIGFYVRSTWEANFARVLQHDGKDFEYESTTFTLKSGRTYTPDFKVGDCYYEVKGWMTPIARQKIEEFLSDYPGIELKIIGPTEYNELQSVYGGLINWE